MSDPWQIRLYEQQKLVYTADLTGPAELGRQETSEEAIYSHHPVERVVIAHKDEKYVSRKHALLEPLAGGGFRLTNLSKELSIGLPDGKELKGEGSRCSVPADALLTIGKKNVRLQMTQSQPLPLQGLPEATVPPGQSFFTVAPFSGLPLSAPAGINMMALVPWLQAAMDVLQSAASSADFFDKAARAVVDLVNLDSGWVLLLKQDEWQTQALHTAPRLAPEATGPVSQHVLGRVRQEKRTFWEVPAPSGSLWKVDAVVAAPILDRQGEVIGALYGDRRKGGGSSSVGPITEVEAVFVQLLARGVAAGLARLEQEQAALEARVQFEQFFTPELARQLARDPSWLAGRTAEVSLLFCDIRGFSRISEQLGAARTVEWCKAVLDHLSRCVLQHEGVLVDYTGDGLMALWGAPDEQPDHASRACRAAISMLAGLPALNAAWQGELGRPMYLGIGINSGAAVVGNVGSEVKFKYGARGPHVNLASRVEGATKYLKCAALITEYTKARVGDEFPTRKLCQVKVINIEQPVELYELALPDRPGWSEARAEYEQALAEFERQRFREASLRLAGLRGRQDDGPALVLLARAVNCMVEVPSPFDPVWVLPGK
jgi:adenylate cyclase